jgi:hypothetical protein
MSIRDTVVSVSNKVDSSEIDKIGRSSRRVFTSSSACYCLKDFCKNAVLTKHYYSPRKNQKIEHGMTGYSFKSKTSCQLLHFDNNPKYSILQDFLGRMVLVGLQRHMRYKDGHVGLRLNDMTYLVLRDSASYATRKACSVK